MWKLTKIGTFLCFSIINMCKMGFLFWDPWKRVSKAKAVIDNKPPNTYLHLHLKLKKLQMEAERMATTMRDNRLLLEKMAHIMRKGGDVDHIKWDYTKKSLNQSKKQKELVRMTHENFAILKRITAREPQYNHNQWLYDWSISQVYMMNISKYPHPWRSEQSHYEKIKQQKMCANKEIREKIRQGGQRIAQLVADSSNTSKTSKTQW